MENQIERNHESIELTAEDESALDRAYETVRRAQDEKWAKDQEHLQQVKRSKLSKRDLRN